MIASAQDELLNSWLSAAYERRHHRRWKINERGAVKCFGSKLPCHVRNISPGGACVEFDGSGKLAVNEKIVLQLAGLLVAT